MKRIWQIALYSFLILLIAPLLISAIWSVAEQWRFPALLPQRLGLRGYHYLIQSSSNSLAIALRSIALSSAVTILTLAVSLPAAKAFGCYDFKYKDVLYTVVLLPILVPAVAVAMGIQISFIRLGIANNVVGVIVIHLLYTTPYAVRILSDVYALVGQKYAVQARQLGAGKWQTFYHVTLPIFAPALLTAGMLSFIISFSQYFLTFFIGGGRVITWSMVMFPFIESGDRMLAATYSIIFIAMVVALLFGVQRWVKAVYKNHNIYYI